MEEGTKEKLLSDKRDLAERFRKIKDEKKIGKRKIELCVQINIDREFTKA